MSGKTPGGMSPTDFKLMALESGQWLWGMVQGAFNQKATLSQIVVDAVIGMIPLVGDVTAVRDITAVSGGLRQRVAGLKNGVIKLKTLGEDMIPHPRLWRWRHTRQCLGRPIGQYRSGQQD